VLAFPSIQALNSATTPMMIAMEVPMRASILWVAHAYRELEPAGEKESTTV
jgi:hypothetical protein